MADTKKPNQSNISISGANVPILYTDIVFMNANEDGVVIDIAQKNGDPSQYQIVTRVGMSREHAKKLAKKLSEILALTTAHTHTTKEERTN